MNLPKAPPEYLQNWGSNLGAWVSRASPTTLEKTEQSEKQVKFGWPRARDRKTKLKFLLNIGKW